MHCFYFVPAKYEAILIKTESREHKRIDEIQYHGHFMCPRIIGQTTHFFIYGIYDTRGYLNLSEPKDMSFEMLRAKIIRAFDIK
jgi:hypothetical protein